ncbi:hypothetical protein DM860_011073 [Cuscuta australis]|uniref:Transcription factor CBF/NF-Y/archaeal histone domain-containing protein n=1 Tax=Cuscuta australis TaxID=267555 RepID=A0A328E563_9ASTE|nr:hypothetical protein DM860_011073 [Cuscuta australis]
MMMEDEETLGSALGSGASPEETSPCSKKEQDKFLPIANVGRIMKKAIPGGGKISKDAKETVQECVSEFISFVTGEASDKCQREKRKTINGDDILWAITTLGFEDYVSPLKIYLNKYRELEGERLNLPPKHHHHHHQNGVVLLDQHNNLGSVYNPSTSVYSTPSNSALISPYVSSPSDHHLQPYLNLPFPATHHTAAAASIQPQFTAAQQEHMDSIAHWQ